LGGLLARGVPPLADHKRALVLVTLASGEGDQDPLARHGDAISAERRAPSAERCHWQPVGQVLSFLG
jgi:hypothetical protein